jgi:putative transposase
MADETHGGLGTARPTNGAATNPVGRGVPTAPSGAADAQAGHGGRGTARPTHNRPVGRGVSTAPRRRTFSHDLPNFIRPEDATFFLTICCQPRGRDQLARPEIARPLFESIVFCQQRGDWWVHFALLMPDHLHALVSFPDGEEMAVVVGNWKKFIARTLGIQWQRDFFEHRLRAEESYREKEDYIWHNPVRAGLVARVEDWPYVWRPSEANGGLGTARPTTAAATPVGRGVPTAPSGATDAQAGHGGLGTARPTTAATNPVGRGVSTAPTTQGDET